MFSFTLAVKADVIQHWPPAGTELNALLKECNVPGERVEEECIQKRMNLDYYLRDVVAAAPEEFARNKQMWPEWHQSKYAKLFPVFKTSGDPFVVFTIYRQDNGELVVTALYFGHPEASAVFYPRLRIEVIEPRVADLASGITRFDRIL